MISKFIAACAAACCSFPVAEVPPQDEIIYASMVRPPRGSDSYSMTDVVWDENERLREEIDRLTAVIAGLEQRLAQLGLQ